MNICKGSLVKLKSGTAPIQVSDRIGDMVAGYYLSSGIRVERNVSELVHYSNKPKKETSPEKPYHQQRYGDHIEEWNVVL